MVTPRLLGLLALWRTAAAVLTERRDQAVRLQAGARGPSDDPAWTYTRASLRPLAPLAAGTSETNGVTAAQAEDMPLFAGAQANATLDAAQQAELTAALEGYPAYGGAWKKKLYNFDDIAYVAVIQVGGQTLRAILDTGSFELLVMSKECTAPSCAMNERYYNSSLSKEYKDLKWQKMHSFGSGDCGSKMGVDRLKLGNVKSPEQVFWKVTDAQMPILLSGEFQAIFGLSHPNEPLIEVGQFLAEDQELLAQYNESDVPEWLNKQKEDDQKFHDALKEHHTFLKQVGMTKFSFCFRKEVGQDGFFIASDVDPKSLKATENPFTTINVHGKTTWSTKMSKVQLQGHNHTLHLDCSWGTCKGLLDTGTSLMTAPAPVIAKITDFVGEIKKDCSNIDDMPDLVFELDGREVRLPPQEYIGIVDGELHKEVRDFMPHVAERRAGDNATCELLMMTMDTVTQEGDALYIVGMPFFRQFYATFDLGDDPKYSNADVERKIHFAPSDGTCDFHPSEPKSKELLLKQKKATPLRRVNLARLQPPKGKFMRSVPKASEKDDLGNTYRPLSIL